MVSFTGSSRAGKLISKNAADTLKRVSLALSVATLCLDPDATPDPAHLRLIHLSPSKFICCLISRPNKSNSEHAAYQIGFRFRWPRLKQTLPVSLHASPPGSGWSFAQVFVELMLADQSWLSLPDNRLPTTSSLEDTTLLLCADNSRITRT